MDNESFERLAITVFEAAAMTGLSRQAIYRLVNNGEIESTRLGVPGHNVGSRRVGLM